MNISIGMMLGTCSGHLHQQIFIASGTWTVPTGVTSVTAQLIGSASGGRSGSIIGGSGGGGGASARSVLTVTPGAILDVHVGVGGASDEDGGDSWFINNTTVLAAGGIGSNGGTGSIGDVTFDGGSSGIHVTTGGGGGSSAGYNDVGTANDQFGGTAPTGGGDGGNGGNVGVNGLNGHSPGGGGGGGGAGVTTGGTGGNGKVILTW